MTCEPHPVASVTASADRKGDRIAVVPEPDSASPYKDYLEADVVPGSAVFVPRGGVETALNVGAQPYIEVIVELKD